MKLILLMIGAGVLAAMIIGLFIFPSYPALQADTQTSAGALSPTSTLPAPRYPFNETATPAELLIPSIGINAQIQQVGIAKDGLMAVTHSFWTVGWYDNGPVPGAPGASVIEGHLDQVISPYAVFFNLDKLKPGDQVEVVDALGRTLDFSVQTTTVEPYDASTSDIFDPPTGAPGNASFLNLITCAGTWIQSQHQYDKRLVVFTERLE